MFSKPNKPEFLAEPMMLTTEAGRRGPKVASLIAEDLIIEGGLSGDVELHIDGAVRGDVRVSRLSIGETGSVEGSIQAESVDCRGRVTGSITAQQVRLYGAAHVDGDITHDQLTVETGAYFQGRSLKLPRAQATPVEVPSIAAE
jgi:cytoskeletal protein CcmA (bactofilin family)